MNDMRAWTKIILGSLGIYLLIEMIPLITNMAAIAYGGLTSQTISGYYVFLILGVVLLLTFLILSVFLLKRERAVRWITRGIPEPAEASEPISWIYFAYRLICFVAGLLLCYRFIMSFPNLLLQIPHYLSGSVKSGFSVLLYYFGLLLLLPVGIYLLCGAPHFVRWQADKTLEMCKEYAHCDPQENLQQ